MVAGWQGSQARSIDVPTLTANIYAAATDITNIHNKTGGICIDIERKNRLHKVCYVPATSTTYSNFSFLFSCCGH